MEIQEAHDLDREEALTRILAAARANGILVESGATRFEGTMAKETPLGTVRLVWEVHGDRVVGRVVEKPAWIADGILLRPLEDALRRALSG